MPAFNKRIQVLLSTDQHKCLETLANRRGTSIGALIRDAIEKLYIQPDEEERLKAVQRITELELPVSEWEQMERESVGGCEVD